MTDSTKNIRVRFAPSPTGTLHVGNARTALFNYLFARKYGGKLVLRVEDTDQERSTAASEESILQDLQWMGIEWDEGPTVGGAFGPYRQSERGHLYQPYIDRLLQERKAYHCFCTKEKIDALRSHQKEQGENPHYPGVCRDLDPEEVAQRLGAGEASVIRLKVPAGDIEFQDRIRDKVRYATDQLGGDFVLVKGDGYPTYNFAVVIDDSLMQISHIIRGEDHLTNTGKQFLLYDMLDLPRPETYHLSMVLGPDRSKLSKRHGSTSVQEFRAKGYLSETLFNYLALLGWNAGDDRELYSHEELIEAFSANRLHKSAAIFDPEKLRWINGKKSRELGAESFCQGAIERLQVLEALPDFWPAETWHERILFFQDAVECFDDLTEFWPVFSDAAFDTDNEKLHDILQWESFEPVYAVVSRFVQALPADGTLDFDALKSAVQQESGAKGKKLFMPLRVALTGQEHGRDLGTMVPWIPASILRERIQNIQTLLPAGGGSQ